MESTFTFTGFNTGYCVAQVKIRPFRYGKKFYDKDAEAILIEG